MGNSALQNFDRNKQELLKNVELAISRGRRVNSDASPDNAQQRWYGSGRRTRCVRSTRLLAGGCGVVGRVFIRTSNPEDALIKAEQSIYQEAGILAIDLLVKDLNLLKARQHLFGPELDEHLLPCLSTIFYCSERSDVPELRLIVKGMRQIYGKKFNPVPDDEVRGPWGIPSVVQLLGKLNPEPPSAERVRKQVEKVTQLVRSSVKSKPPAEKQSSPPGKVRMKCVTNNLAQRAEFDELVERIHRLRS
ncbi:aspartate-semialdehyde dehydrogenase [Babesia caballi]|uniref:Aspartate-semialdehyde dehydrogenase n=1 Tax=Babesia caballi TaxID=5871 RepID=A0AAV4LRM7_BABCB|nr:aspartate-semialdehyde dehydrogenase [Babesia caballi]